MNHPVVGDRVASRSRRQRHARPVLEGLEERMLLYAVSGDHFQFGSRITWSLMPDGTNLGGIPSNLFQTMNAKFGAGWWEPAIDDAFAQWESYANVNFVQILDSGQQLGSGPYQQGDPGIGDIRIGGMAQSSSILSFTFVPPVANGGSDAGDMLLNTNIAWNLGSNVDLETVMLHEIGHALGMDHSTDPNAVMYPYYGGVDNALGTDDIAGVQSIWGARQYDPFVLNFNNLSMTNASSLNNWLNTSNNQIVIPGLNLVNASETEWFKVTTPLNASNVFTAQVQSSNLSELSPRIQIYNAAGVGLVQNSASASSYGATVKASISNATPGATYYIKVLGSNAGDTGDGAYALEVNMGSQATALSPPPNTVVAAAADQGGGVDQLTIGGTGSIFKSLVLACDPLGLTTSQIESDANLNAALNTIASELSSSSSLDIAALEEVLNGLLQDVPTNDLVIINNAMTSLDQYSTKTGNSSISLKSLGPILSPLLGDLDSIFPRDKK